MLKTGTVSYIEGSVCKRVHVAKLVLHILTVILILTIEK